MLEGGLRGDVGGWGLRGDDGAFERAAIGLYRLCQREGLKKKKNLVV